MKQKYTYQDWLDDKEIPVPLERVQHGDIFLKMVRENILSKEDYRKIKKEQEWTYKKSVKNYSNYHKSELGTRLQFSEYPDDLYQLEIEEFKEMTPSQFTDRLEVESRRGVTPSQFTDRLEVESRRGLHVG